MKFLIFHIFIFLALHSVMAIPENKKNDLTLIFIHGANFKKNAWDSIKSLLKGLKTIAINLPGRNDQIPFPEITLESSSKSLCFWINKIEGRIILVGHSQAGAIINQALGLCDFKKIQSIVYVAAVIPLNKEKPYDLLTKNDESHYFSGIEFLEKNSEFRIYNYDNFFNSFAQDSNLMQRELIKNSSTSEPSNIGNGVLSFDMNLFNNLRKYYVFTKEDKIISLETQKNITKRINFLKTFQVVSGHLPMITSQNNLTKILLEIASKESHQVKK